MAAPRARPEPGGHRLAAENVRLAPLPFFDGLPRFFEALPWVLLGLWRAIGRADLVRPPAANAAGTWAFSLARLRRRPVFLLVVGDLAGVAASVPADSLKRRIYRLYVRLEERLIQAMVDRALTITNGRALYEKHRRPAGRSSRRATAPYPVGRRRAPTTGLPATPGATAVRQSNRPAQGTAPSASRPGGPARARARADARPARSDGRPIGRRRADRHARGCPPSRSRRGHPIPGRGLDRAGLRRLRRARPAGRPEPAGGRHPAGPARSHGGRPTRSWRRASRASRIWSRMAGTAC